MKRSDIGKRSQSNSGGGFLGALLGGKTASQQAQQTMAAEQESITPRGEGKIEPTPKAISIGITPYGETVNLPLFEKSTLVAGQSGSGKSYCANRILMEIFKIPKSQRVVVGIDLKSGTEIGKSQYCLDAFAINLEAADTILTNIAAEMDRRHRLINSNPSEYWDGKTHPSDRVPLLVCFVDELAMLGKKATTKAVEEIRQHAWSQLDRLLYLGRNAGICTICCIQRPDAKIVDSFSRAQFQCRLAGYVSSRTDSDMIFGLGTAEQGIDASRLSDHWFISFIEGKGYQRFKTPGDPADADLKEVFLNPRYYCPKGRGAWLTAEPDTPEAIAPWWPDSPYHEDFLNGFRDEDDEPETGYEPAGGSYAEDDGYQRPRRPASRRPPRRPASPRNESVYSDPDLDDLEECEPFWEREGYDPTPRPSRPRRASRGAGASPSPSPRRSPRRPDESADYEMPWDEPERPKRRSPRRTPHPADYEDIEETSLEDLLDMGVDPETVLKMHRNSTNNRTETGSGTKPSGPRVEYRRAGNAELVDDLNASFDEVDITDDLDDWGEKVILGDDDDDEYIVDYEAATREALGEECEQGRDAKPDSGTREAVSGPRSPEPVDEDEPIMALPPHAVKPQPQVAHPVEQSAPQPSATDKKKPVRRRRRRYEVEEEFMNPPGERPRMINGMPVL